jgi:tRNA(adenine34) deaminase
MDDANFMDEAIRLARLAAAEGEVPVGCVIVKDGAIIGRGRNSRERARSALGHAEIMAIEEACQTLNNWRLSGCSIYVTLEPCPMCAGAIINSRISRIYFGARDEKSGSCGSVINLFEEDFGHKPEIYGRVYEEECSALLSEFFKTLRD